MSNLFKLFLFFIKHRDSVIRNLNISADVILGSGCSLHRGVTIISVFTTDYYSIFYR